MYYNNTVWWILENECDSNSRSVKNRWSWRLWSPGLPLRCCTWRPPPCCPVTSGPGTSAGAKTRGPACWWRRWTRTRGPTTATTWHMFHFYHNLQCSIEVKSVMIINIPWQQSHLIMTRLYSRIHHFIYYRPATALAHLRTGDGRHADRLHLRVDHQLACQKLCQKLLTKTC